MQIYVSIKHACHGIMLYHNVILYDCMSTNVCVRCIVKESLFMEAFWQCAENVSPRGIKFYYYYNHGTIPWPSYIVTCGNLKT